MPDASHQYVKDRPSVDITSGASAPADRSLHRPGGTTAVREPPSWFLTTLTVLAFRGFVGLLHPTANHGVHQVSPSRRACLRAFRGHLPVPRPPERFPPPVAASASPRLPAPLPFAIPRDGATSRPCSTGESVAHPPRCREGCARCSPGLSHLELPEPLAGAEAPAQCWCRGDPSWRCHPPPSCLVNDPSPCSARPASTPRGFDTSLAGRSAARKAWRHPSTTRANPRPRRSVRRPAPTRVGLAPKCGTPTWQCALPFHVASPRRPEGRRDPRVLPGTCRLARPLGGGSRRRRAVPPAVSTRR
jgi:hypothetical protein